MKKTLFLIAIEILSIATVNSTTVDNIKYSLSGEYATVVGIENYVDYLEIPEQIVINGYTYTVTSIGSHAFCYPSHTNVECPKEIKLPETITDIYERAFGTYSYSSNLSKINLPQSLTHLYSNCFFRTNIVSLIIPQGVTQMGDNNSGYGDNAIDECPLLKKIIYLPNKAPSYWTATSKTYVPSLDNYSTPSKRINSAQIIEMITWKQKDFNYTGNSPVPTFTNNVEGYTAVMDPSVQFEKNAGNWETMVKFQFKSESGSEEDFVVDIPFKYSISKNDLIVNVANASRVYGDPNPNFEISYTGFILGEDEKVLTTKPMASTMATKTTNVGDYPITVSGGVATNYEFVYEPGVLTITKAPLSAKVNDATRVYGSQNPAFTIEYYGLKNNETTPAWTISPTFQTEATQSSSVGKYEVKAVNGVPVNYDLGEITAGTLTVNPAPLTIKANDATRQYYSDDPNFGYTCNGFVNGENEEVLSPKPALTTTANRSSSVGTYPIKVSGASNSNYSISYINGTLTITPRTLTASVGNYERLYNEENPAFDVIYNGFVGSDNVNVLSTVPVARTSATRTSDVGTYPIEVSGGSADNYTFSYVSGTLTINKAEQTISWNQDLSNLNVGDQVELKAVASSGLPITYTMDNNNAAEIYWTGNKSYLDCIAEGEFQIVAIQDGNTNYYSSPKVRKNVVIGNGGTGIDAINSEESECQYYSLDGRPLKHPVQGVNIVRMSDGKVKKVVVSH